MSQEDASSSSTYLPYEEPVIDIILIQSSFLVLLNIANYVLDRIVYCGLVGQILLGVAWGEPGAKWLPRHVQEVMGQLGYLGLILIVYEGGLSISLPALRANLLLSTGVAITGIAVPISLSFVLMPLISATKLQAFAAGAALCSTSLGTTFTVLGTSGLATSRLGVILSSAAMLDDVVGLIMVQVISNLGGGKIEPMTVARPIIVALGLVVVLVMACRFVIKPAIFVANKGLKNLAKREDLSWGSTKHAKLVLHILILVGFVAGASYAGTSNLFAAYLAGVLVSWIDGMDGMHGATGPELYHEYLEIAVEKILKPFFFGSIGFSIPISRMFLGHVLWRGLIYFILMATGKMVCGFWLLPWPPAFLWLGRKGDKPTDHNQQLNRRLKHKKVVKTDGSQTVEQPESNLKLEGVSNQPQRALSARDVGPSHSTSSPGRISPVQQRQSMANMSSKRSPPTARTASLYPASMLGSAMVARGEIGFLISSLAESSGTFSGSSTRNNEPSELYLIVTWAIMLCTILGPIAVGVLVRRVRRLQSSERQEADGRQDPLGIWGFVSI